MMICHRGDGFLVLGHVSAHECAVARGNVGECNLHGLLQIFFPEARK
jgi:hypothetical protein